MPDLDHLRLDHIRIVLVETTHPGNIGSAARAMHTMGLSQLHLVNPRTFPSDHATALASSATALLDQAHIHPTLDDALGDCQLVIATSSRARHIPWPCISAHELGEHLDSLSTSTNAQPNIAILFGREDRGLTNDELHRCNLHVTIPTNPDYGVLNVAAAVQVICYELRLALTNDSTPSHHPHQRTLPNIPWDQPPASHQDIQRMLTHLERVMTQTGFLHPDHPGHVMTRLQRLFLRAQPDDTEINILRGLLTAIEKQRS